MSAKEYFYRLIAQHQPIDRYAIGQHAMPAGFSSNYITQTLKVLRDEGVVANNDGPYVLGPNKPGPFYSATGGRPKPANGANGAHAPARSRAREAGRKDPEEGAPKGAARKQSEPDSQPGKLLTFMRKQKGQVSYKEMKDYFTKVKMPINSAGIALLTLRTQGFVKRVGPALYEYVP